MAMHIISRKKLRAFWRRHREAEAALRAWHTTARNATWESLLDVRAMISSADQVGRFKVFDIARQYRLIAVIHWNRRKIYVRHILTHDEYVRGVWKRT